MIRRLTILNYTMRIFLLVLLSFGYSSIIKVPAHQPTIQEGINAAVEGDICGCLP